MSIKINIKVFFHKITSTISYVIYKDKHAVIIDSVLDFDLQNGKISSHFADKQLDFIKRHDLTLVYIFETHAHADHLTSASYLRDKTGAKIAVSANIIGIQKYFKTFYNDKALIADGRCFDLLLNDNDSVDFSGESIKVLAVPGHTNDSIALLIDGNVFIGDSLFMPDQGTARCDFPGGDATMLFKSVSKLHALPDHFILWMCHDYQPMGRKLVYNITVRESRQHNIHINERTAVAEFVKTRKNRDAMLALPKLLYPAIQVNIHAGKLPLKEENGQVYFKIPVTT
ncbi:MAG: MBL fold metallo-hydrolase [Psychromonas sp.]|nr:MBL fold metallo-hydrolase [Psychromonas sp.]